MERKLEDNALPAPVHSWPIEDHGIVARHYGSWFVSVHLKKEFSDADYKSVKHWFFYANTEVRIFFRVCITSTETVNQTLFVWAIKFYILIVSMNGAPSFQTFSNLFLINVKLFGCGGNSFFPRKFIGLQPTLEDSVLWNRAKLIHIVNCTP